MTIRPLALHHVAICVDDLDVAIAFYTGVLGLKLADRPSSLPNPGAWLDLGGQQVHLLAGDDRGPGTFAHFSMVVDSLDRVGEILAGDGIALEDRQVVEGYGEQAFVHDPAGNLVELYELLAPGAGG